MGAVKQCVVVVAGTARPMTTEFLMRTHLTQPYREKYVPRMYANERE